MLFYGSTPTDSREMKSEEAMKRISRKLLTVPAAASLVVLTACSQGIENPPALSEIESALWQNMRQEETVTIKTTVERLAASISDDHETLEEILDEHGAGFTIYGDLQGSAVAIGFGDADVMRVFDQEEAYFSVETLLTLMGSEAFGADTAQQNLDSMAEEYANTWVDFSSEIEARTHDFKIGPLLSQIRESWAGNASTAEAPLLCDAISDKGSHEVRDEQDVWVYQGAAEDQELVVEADLESPKIVAMINGEQKISFSGWGETESPQRPEESQIIDRGEFESRVMQGLQDGTD